jgi:F-type H+-transporting ATPase subunit alpha
MKQPQYSPMSVGQMAVSLFAVNQGYLDDVPVNKVVDFEAALQTYLKSERSDLVSKIDETADYNDEVEQALHEAIKSFKASHAW